MATKKADEVNEAAEGMLVDCRTSKSTSSLWLLDDPHHSVELLQLGLQSPDTLAPSALRSDHSMAMRGLLASADVKAKLIQSQFPALPRLT